jgi:4-hydroxy-3-methylbut-2-enyl diphosphate reductase
VETEDELRPEWFEECAVVGVSAGASTPDWVIDGVAARLGAIEGRPRLTQ